MRASERVGWADAGLLLSSVLWGLNFTTVKIALGQLPPEALGFLRFAVAGALLVALLAAVERDLRVARRDLGRLLVMGALSIGANQLLFLDGMNRTSAAIGAIMFACASAFTILLAMLLLGEHAGPKLWVGILLAMVGIGLIVGVGGTNGTGTWLGEGEVFLSALAVGISSLLAKDVLRRYSALRVTAWSTVFGLCCLAPFAVGALPAIHWPAVQARTWAAFGFTAVGASVVTLLLWNAGIARVGVTRATVYSYLQPILGVLFAALLLGDHLTVQQLAGGGVALVGTWLASAATLARAARPDALQTVRTAALAPVGATSGSAGTGGN
jgi:drug/metabolite transporter (DMT)-like permease